MQCGSCIIEEMAFMLLTIKTLNLNKDPLTQVGKFTEIMGFDSNRLRVRHEGYTDAC